MQNSSCNRMSNTVSAKQRHNLQANPASLYTARGARKYLTRDERQRVLARMAERGTDTDLLALTLAWTGARVSEILALTPQAFQLDTGVIALRTLKRRRPVMREVPVPPMLMTGLEARFGLRAAQRDGDAATQPLWRCCRVTVWRHVRASMKEVGIVGRHACPRGLRHGFGVGTLQSGVPLSLLKCWMGHARLETTAIYADVSGPEERGFAIGFHRWSEARAA